MMKKPPSPFWISSAAIPVASFASSAFDLKPFGSILLIQKNRHRCKQICSGFLALALLLTARAEGDLPAYKNPALPVEMRVTNLLSLMTTDEKIAQLQCQMGPEVLKNGTRDYTVGFIRSVGIAAKASECARLNNEDMRHCIEDTRLGIPVLNHEETLHAVSTIPSTLFPNSLAMAATWDEDLAYRAYSAISREGMAVNIRQHYSPCLYFCRDPRWGRMEETYGEDPLLVTRFGLAFVKAIRDAGAVPTLKGYPVNYGDGGRDSYPAYISERQYRELWFVPWEAAVKKYGDVMSVMPAYSTINDVPVHADPWLLTKILRDEWGYQGIVTSDYGDHAKGLVYNSHIAENEEEGAKMLLEAGLDSVHPNGTPALPKAVHDGVVPMALLDRSVARVLRVKFLAGMFDHPYVDATAADRIVRSPENLALALAAAQKSMVLLKNEKQILPLKKSGTISVFGPAASTFFPGGYGRYVMPSDVTPLRGLKERAGGKVQFLVHDGKSDPAALARQSDAAVIFCTIVEGEAFDRADLNLPVFKGDKKPRAVKDDFTIIVNDNDREFSPGDQEALIRTVARTGVPTVVVLVAGSPVTMQNWIKDVSAVVQMWYAGEKGGLAIADVLFGDVNPGGRLPVTFPKTVGQVPIYYSHGPLGRSDKYWDDDGRPQFPFGFGLSYTTFAESNLKITSTATSAGSGAVTVQVDVKNTGLVSGDDVVQVYLHQERASVARPNEELKGFQRLTLAPGETKTASITIPADELALLDRNLKRIIEPGWFTVMIGRNAEDIILKGRFEVR